MTNRLMLLLVAVYYYLIIIYFYYYKLLVFISCYKISISWYSLELIYVKENCLQYECVKRNMMKINILKPLQFFPIVRNISVYGIDIMVKYLWIWWYKAVLEL